MRKKQKWLIGASIAVAVGLASYGAYAHHAEVEAQKAEKRAQVQAGIKEKLEGYQQEVNGWFTDEEKALLKAKVSPEMVAKVKEALDEWKGSAFSASNASRVNILVQDVGYAEQMATVQEEVNGLVDAKGALLENANWAEVEKRVQPTLDKLRADKQAFVEAQQEKLEAAKGQWETIQRATNSVRAMFTTESLQEVKANIGEAAYTQAKEQVAKIQQPQAKEVLIKALEKVDAKREQEQAAAQKNQQNVAINDSETASLNESNTEASTSNGASSSANNSGSSGSSNNSGSSSSSGGSSQKSASGSTKGSAGSSAKSSGGSASSKGSASSDKSSSGSSKSTGGNNSGSKSNSNGGNKSNYDYDKKSDTEKNVNGGTNDYWGW